jgi:predicted Zn-dependent protease
MEKKGALNLVPLLLGFIAVGVMMWRGCEEGPFGRKRVINLSPDEEVRLGAQAFHEVLSKEHVLPEGPLVAAVRHVGRQLADASEDSELRQAMGLKPMKFDWEFRVVESKQVNAFCLPGGKVVVYTGIIPVCATDAGLATVMGHEIGHALARHGAERISQERIIQVGQTAVAFSLGDMDSRKRAQVIALLGAATSVGLKLPFSRSHESEADHIGLLLMARAGYDPAEAPEFWQRMQRATAGGGRPPEFLSTHPNPETRIADLRRWQPQAEMFYRTSVKQRSRPLPGVGDLRSKVLPVRTQSEVLTSGLPHPGTHGEGERLLPGVSYLISARP